MAADPPPQPKSKSQPGNRRPTGSSMDVYQSTRGSEGQAGRPGGSASGQGVPMFRNSDREGPEKVAQKKSGNPTTRGTKATAGGSTGAAAGGKRRREEKKAHKASDAIDLTADSDEDPDQTESDDDTTTKGPNKGTTTTKRHKAGDAEVTVRRSSAEGLGRGGGHLPYI